MTKRKIGKLNLRRETLSNLDLGQANGGDISVINTARSVCQVCLAYPVTTTRITTTTWPETIGNPGTTVINPAGGF